MIDLLVKIANGALSGATGGKISIESAINLATKTAAARIDVPITKPVAEAIAKEMPAPRAMEGLGWQNVRSALIALGGYFVGRGYVDDSQMQAIVGVAMIVLPWAYRNISTWLARDAAKA